MKQLYFVTLTTPAGARQRKARVHRYVTLAISPEDALANVREESSHIREEVISEHVEPAGYDTINLGVHLRDLP